MLEYTKDKLRHPHLPLIPIHHMEAHALTVRMVQRYAEHKKYTVT